MQFVVYESRFNLNSKTTANEPAAEANEDVLETSDSGNVINDDNLDVNSEEVMDVTNQTTVLEESPDTTNEHLDGVSDNVLETSESGNIVATNDNLDEAMDLASQAIVEEGSTKEDENLSFEVKKEILVPSEDLDGEKDEPEHSDQRVRKPLYDSEESTLMVTEVVEHSSITPIPWDKTKSEKKLELEKRGGSEVVVEEDVDHRKDQEQERAETPSPSLMISSITGDANDIFSQKGNSRQV